MAGEDWNITITQQSCPFRSFIKFECGLIDGKPTCDEKICPVKEKK